jgi:hypothetical protein
MVEPRGSEPTLCLIRHYRGGSASPYHFPEDESLIRARQRFEMWK